jgi:GDP-D-mannose dehydratase
VLNILKASFLPTAKFYQTSSSEMFGNSVDEDGFQRESTAMSPVSLMVVLKYLDIMLNIIETPINYMRVMVYYLIMNHQDVHLICNK